MRTTLVEYHREMLSDLPQDVLPGSSMGSAMEEREPCGTVKCNTGWAIIVPRLLVIDCDVL